MSAALYVVAMQHSDRSSESTTLRLLSVTIEEVRIGCDGVPNSRKMIDACGVCGGENACVGCDGVPLSGKLVDACGVCAGDGKSCADCAGVPRGSSKLDECGVCNGHNECMLGSADRIAAYRKMQAERFAGQDAALLETSRRHNVDNTNSDNNNHNNINNNNSNENINNNNNNPSTQNERKRATVGKPPKVCDSADLSGPCYDAVDCSGRLKREGGKLEYDACGVCGGNNECVGCDGRPFGKKSLSFFSPFSFVHARNKLLSLFLDTMLVESVVATIVLAVLTTAMFPINTGTLCCYQVCFCSF